MSVTIRPSTESPRNSRRSFVTSRPCSNANDRCVNAASRSPGSRNTTPSATSSAPTWTASGDRTWLLDLDRLAARVVTAVRTHAVRLVRLLALRAGAVRARRRLPRRAALGGASLALLLLRDSHRRYLLGGGIRSGRRSWGARATGGRAPRSADRSPRGPGARRGCG